MTPGPFKALIFDMDGTIVDNMPYHNAAWVKFFATKGIALDLDGFFASTAGMNNAEILTRYFPDADHDTLERFGEEKEAFYRAVYRPNAAPLPGLLALMTDADRRGVPMAVATAAPPGNIEVVLDTLKLRDRFVTVVSPSQGFRGKPHPDLFLEAARRMGVTPDTCVVFEDAPLGIEAARLAGMKAVAMLTMLDADALQKPGTVIAAIADFTVLDAGALLGPDTA